VFAVLLLAACVRIGYVALAKRGPCAIETAGHVVGEYHSQCTGSGATTANDQVYYNAAANQLADGHGFINAFQPGQEAADHPPLTAVVLAGVSFAFNHEPLSHLADVTHLPSGSVRTHVREQRYFMALLGTFNVFLLMLLARRLAGPRIALLAGVFAALYPYLWVNDGLLFSETIAISCVLGVLLATCWCRDRPSVVRFGLLGLLCALASLARAELLMLAPLLVLAVAWWVRAKGARVAIAGVLAGAVGALLLLGPWFAYNASRFRDRVYISTNDGLALAGSNCGPMYYGAGVGLTNLTPPCTYSAAQLAHLDAIDVAEHGHHLDQSEISDLYRGKATTYIHHHLGRAAVVVAARVGRVWSIFRPFDMVSYNQGESRERWVTELGLVAYYPLVLLAIGGVVTLVRRRGGRDLWMLVVPAISVTLFAAATYGQTRLRATAEPSIVLLAAIGAAALAEAWRARARAGAAATPLP
jgi:4-amino-4-deoxy-L-arabinose transferase-like glycosyltransferase